MSKINWLSNEKYGWKMCNRPPCLIQGVAEKREIMKTKLSLCLSFNWAPRHEGVLEEWRYSSTHSLTSALDGGSGRFTPWERAPGTHWIGGWVGPRTVLDAVVKRKIPSPRRESNPRTPIVQSVWWSRTALPVSIHMNTPWLTWKKCLDLLSYFSCLLSKNN
jgi:hypothetical protein